MCYISPHQTQNNSIPGQSVMVILNITEVLSHPKKCREIDGAVRSKLWHTEQHLLLFGRRHTRCSHAETCT